MSRQHCFQPPPPRSSHSLATLLVYCQMLETLLRAHEGWTGYYYPTQKTGPRRCLLYWRRGTAHVTRSSTCLVRRSGVHLFNAFLSRLLGWSRTLEWPDSVRQHDSSVDGGRARAHGPLAGLTRLTVGISWDGDAQAWPIRHIWVALFRH